MKPEKSTFTNISRQNLQSPKKQRTSQSPTKDQETSFTQDAINYIQILSSEIYSTYSPPERAKNCTPTVCLHLQTHSNETKEEICFKIESKEQSK